MKKLSIKRCSSLFYSRKMQLGCRSGIPNRWLNGWGAAAAVRCGRSSAGTSRGRSAPAARRRSRCCPCPDAGSLVAQQRPAADAEVVQAGEDRHRHVGGIRRQLSTLACIDRPMAMIAIPQKMHSTVRWLSLPAAGNSSTGLNVSSAMAPIKSRKENARCSG